MCLQDTKILYDKINKRIKLRKHNILSRSKLSIKSEWKFDKSCNINKRKETIFTFTKLLCPIFKYALNKSAIVDYVRIYKTHE